MENVGTVVISKEQIEKRVAELGKQITEDYKGKDLLLVGILKGSLIFMADLIRQIDLPLEIDFMAVSSYGASTKSSGIVQIIKDLKNNIEGKTILICEDIVDTGLTLSYLVGYLKSRGAADVKVVALLNKPSGRKAEVPLEYWGFEIGDFFAIGYGLDYAEKYRNLDGVYDINPDLIQK